MKIIDAHLHLFPEPWADEVARGVGHENTIEHLRLAYGELGVVHGVVMGNRSLETDRHDYPADLFHYCVGLDRMVLDEGRNIPADLPGRVEEHLKRDNCCGVKLYPGYNRIWLSDPLYSPIYELAWWRKTPMWLPTCPACWRAGWIWSGISRSRRGMPAC